MKIQSQAPSRRAMPVALAIFTSLALALSAPAMARPSKGGGGGHGGGGHASAGGHGGQQGRASAQRSHDRPNNVQADKRTNNVRNTSVNNVNVNKNVNVNVEGHGGGCCHNGWDDDYHPVATAAAVTAAVAVTSAVVGSIVHSVPANCVPVNYSGMVYQQCGSTWYQPQGSQYIVVNPPY